MVGVFSAKRSGLAAVLPTSIDTQAHWQTSAQFLHAEKETRFNFSVMHCAAIPTSAVNL
jgi:hypothetical protein